MIQGILSSASLRTI